MLTNFLEFLDQDFNLGEPYQRLFVSIKTEPDKVRHLVEHYILTDASKDKVKLYWLKGMAWMAEYARNPSTNGSFLAQANEAFSFAKQATESSKDYFAGNKNPSPTSTAIYKLVFLGNEWVKFPTLLKNFSAKEFVKYYKGAPATECWFYTSALKPSVPTKEASVKTPVTAATARAEVKHVVMSGIEEVTPPATPIKSPAADATTTATTDAKRDKTASTQSPADAKLSQDLGGVAQNILVKTPQISPEDLAKKLLTNPDLLALVEKRIAEQDKSAKAELALIKSEVYGIRKQLAELQQNKPETKADKTADLAWEEKFRLLENALETSVKREFELEEIAREQEFIRQDKKLTAYYDQRVKLTSFMYAMLAINSQLVGLDSKASLTFFGKALDFVSLGFGSIITETAQGYSDKGKMITAEEVCLRNFLDTAAAEAIFETTFRKLTLRYQEFIKRASLDENFDKDDAEYEAKRVAAENEVIEKMPEAKGFFAWMKKGWKVIKNTVTSAKKEFYKKCSQLKKDAYKKFNVKSPKSGVHALAKGAILRIINAFIEEKAALNVDTLLDSVFNSELKHYTVIKEEKLPNEQIKRMNDLRVYRESPIRVKSHDGQEDKIFWRGPDKHKDKRCRRSPELGCRLGTEAEALKLGLELYKPPAPALSAAALSPSSGATATPPLEVKATPASPVATAVKPKQEAKATNATNTFLGRIHDTETTVAQLKDQLAAMAKQLQFFQTHFSQVQSPEFIEWCNRKATQQAQQSPATQVLAGGISSPTAAMSQLFSNLNSPTGSSGSTDSATSDGASSSASDASTSKKIDEAAIIPAITTSPQLT